MNIKTEKIELSKNFLIHRPKPTPETHAIVSEKYDNPYNGLSCGYIAAIPKEEVGLWTIKMLCRRIMDKVFGRAPFFVPKPQKLLENKHNEL